MCSLGLVRAVGYTGWKLMSYVIPSKINGQTECTLGRKHVAAAVALAHAHHGRVESIENIRHLPC